MSVGYLTEWQTEISTLQPLKGFRGADDMAGMLDIFFRRRLAAVQLICGHIPKNEVGEKGGTILHSWSNGKK